MIKAMKFIGKFGVGMMIGYYGCELARYMGWIK